MSDNTDLANQLFDAIERGDVETLKGLYRDDAQIWHNTDNTVKSKDHVMQLVQWMADNMPATKYVDRNISRTDDGFVSRHTVIITNNDGGEVHLPICVVATVADGQITHLYEYFDSATQSQTGIAVSE